LPSECTSKDCMFDFIKERNGIPKRYGEFSNAPLLVNAGMVFSLNLAGILAC
jgi:hypothetical protein